MPSLYLGYVMHYLSGLVFLSTDLINRIQSMLKRLVSLVILQA